MKKQAILLVAGFGALTLTSCGPTSVEVTEQEWDAGVKVGLKSEYQITSTATTAMSFTGLGEKIDDLEEFDYRYQLFRSGTF